MKQQMQKVFKLLSKDEELLRLLYYKPEHRDDDPLSVSKMNILEMPEEEKFEIIDDRIATTPKVEDLDSEKKCRVLIYLTRRRAETGNFWVSEQRFVVDVIVHHEFHEADLRLYWICDKINDLMFNQHVAGSGKLTFDDGDDIGVPNGYVGYRMIFSYIEQN